jgi:iron(III) transport system substrate-binding protein
MKGGCSSAGSERIGLEFSQVPFIGVVVFRSIVFNAITIALAIFGSARFACSEGNKPAALAELAPYTGPNREQLLLSGARTEGKVVWYTSFTGNSYKEVARAFEAQYPEVKIEVFRAANKELLAKITAENQAKHFIADTLESTLGLLGGLREDSMLASFTSRYANAYPASAKERGERGLYLWVIHRESYNGVGYNTDRIPPARAPKKFDDLLKTEFKGKMAFANGDTGARMIAAMLKAKGEEYIKRLRNQEYSLHSLSARALADLVAAGEVELSPTISREHAIEVKRKGGSIGWAPMEVVPTNAGGVALVKTAPHRHAALLLADFILSPRGQKIFAEFDFADPAGDSGLNRFYPERGLTSEQYENQMNRWLKLLRDNGRR